MMLELLGLILKYVLRPYWLCMTYENKKGNNKWKEKNQIGEKRGFCQPVAKYEKQANISTRTSTKSSSVLKKIRKRKKGNKEKTNNKIEPSQVHWTRGKKTLNQKTKTNLKSMKEKLPIRSNKYPLPCNRFHLCTVSDFIRYVDRLS